jgi:hypothetical protein
MRRTTTRGRGRLPLRRALAALVIALSMAAATPGSAAPQESPPPPPVGPSVAFYGDSIGYNAETELRAAIQSQYRFRYHAAGGSDITYWLPKLTRLVTGPNRPDTLLIELGTADAGWSHGRRRFERDVRALLDVASPVVPCIRWFDLRSEPSLFEEVNERAIDFNRIIAEVADEYPNVEVMHYSHWATLANAGDYWWPDLLHHNASGRRQLALMVKQAAVGCDPARTTGPFWDTPDASPLAPAVAWMLADGITTGFPNHTFRAVIGSLRPPVNRGQALQWLWHLAGSPGVATPHPWTDGTVRLSSAMNWSADAGIMGGYIDGTWHPKQTVSRADLVAALWHLAGSPVFETPNPWIDVPEDLAPAFAWAASIALVTGSEDGTVRPDAPQTRGQVARILFGYHVAVEAAIAAVTATPAE